MELLSQDIEKISTVLDVAKLCRVERLAFVNGGAYGMSDTSQAVIISDCELSIPASVSIGIASVTDFQKRLKLFKNAKVTLELRQETKTKRVIFSTAKSSMSYRCTDISRLGDSPRGINAQVVGAFNVSKAEALELKNAISALTKPEYIYINIDSSSVVEFSIFDSSNDSFEIKLDSPVELEEDSIDYSRKFDVRGPFMNGMNEMLKSDKIIFEIMDSSDLKMKFDTVDVYLIPSITSDED